MEGLQLSAHDGTTLEGRAVIIVALWLLPLFLSAMLVACSATTSGESTSRPEVEIVDPARLSEHQLEVIELFNESGEVTFADYAQAQWDFLSCMDGAGFQYWAEEATLMGYPVITYSIAIPPEMIDENDQTPVMDSIWNECNVRHALYVDDLYNQIEQRKAWPKIEETFKPLIRACLGNRHVELGDDLSLGDLLQLSYEESTTSQYPQSCAEETGYYAATSFPVAEPGE